MMNSFPSNMMSSFPSHVMDSRKYEMNSIPTARKTPLYNYNVCRYKYIRGLQTIFFSVPSPLFSRVPPAVPTAVPSPADAMIRVLYVLLTIHKRDNGIYSDHKNNCHDDENRISSVRHATL